MLSWLRRIFGRGGVEPETSGFEKTEALLRERRPDLADEFSALWFRPCTETLDFLNKHFPVEGGWGARLIHETPRDVADWLDAHQ